MSAATASVEVKVAGAAAADDGDGDGDGDGAAPPGRYNHTAVVSEDAMYVFGGQGRYGCLDDLWRFDFVTSRWTRIDRGETKGAPPPPRAGHCACVGAAGGARGARVMFVFGGSNPVGPDGAGSVSYDDLYAYNLRSDEWLAVETKWRKPRGGDGCAIASFGGVIYALSRSELGESMHAWCLELDTRRGRPRWTQAGRAGTPPTPRTDYVAATYGVNWLVHGGRAVNGANGGGGVLGDCYAFHFPSGEWAKLAEDAEADRRCCHAGAAIDGAFVLLHGKRGAVGDDARGDARGEGDDAGADGGDEKDPGPCFAVNLDQYLPFPEASDSMMNTSVVPSNAGSDDERDTTTTRGNGDEYAREASAFLRSRRATESKVAARDGVLHVKCVGGSDLLAADRITKKSDPYLILRCGSARFKTKIKSRTLRPTWNETFEIPVSATQRLSGRVSFECRDHDKIGKDDFLGTATLKISDVPEDGATREYALSLEGVNRGTIQCEARFEPTGPPLDAGQLAKDENADDEEEVNDVAMSSDDTKTTNTSKSEKAEEIAPADSSHSPATTPGRFDATEEPTDRAVPLTTAAALNRRGLRCVLYTGSHTTAFAW